MYRTLRTLGIAVLALVAVGLIVLASAGEYNSLRQTHNESGYMYLFQQGKWLGISFFVMLAASFFDYHKWREWPWLTIAFYVFVVILMALVWAFPATKGSHRWLRFGSMRLQPSEFAKILVVISSAVMLDRLGWRIERLLKGVLPVVGVATVLMALAIAEPDFGATVVMAATVGAMVFVAGMRWRYVLAFLFLGATGFCTLLYFNANRMNRIIAWMPGWMASLFGIPPEVVAANAEKAASYQTQHALMAIQGGGITGVGFSMSKEKLNYLPEAHTDFIFAIGAEEWGLVFSVVLLTLFIVLFVCGLAISAKAPDRLGRLLAYGMTFLIFFQAMFNLAVVTDLLPPKGLALPFISYGGTNLITAMVAIGTLFNVGRQIELPEERKAATFT